MDNHERGSNKDENSSELRKLLEEYLFDGDGDTIPHPTGFCEDMLDDVAFEFIHRIDFFGKTESEFSSESDKNYEFSRSIWNELRYAICIGAAIERGDLNLDMPPA